MKTKLLLLIGMLCTYLPRLYAQTQDDARTGFDGVWLYNGDNLTRNKLNGLKTDKPYLTGGMIAIKWSELQPSDSTHFTWSMIDTPLTRLSDTGMYAEIMIWAGPHTPGWVYSLVPPVVTNDQDHTWDQYPSYLDPDYKRLWFRMMDSVAAHINALPAAKRNRILIYQSAEGTTGDASAFKGTSTDTGWFSNGSPKWAALRQEAWLHLNSLYGSTNPKIHLLLNQGGGFEQNNWINNNIPLAWRKDPGGAHSYQSNYEVADKDSLNPLVNVPVGGCATKGRARDEQDNQYHSAGFDKHRKWWYMSTAQSALNIGIDLWFIQSDIQLPDYDAAFRFFARYAGRKDASCSPAAFCSLRDGLDAWDTARFSKAVYGNWGTDALDTVRCKNIAAAFAARGARQDAPAFATSDINGPTGQRNTTGLNDVGWSIFPGNYERFIHQLSANSTSVGYWRVGDTSTVYGRFARGTQHSSNKDTLFFDLQDDFFSGSGNKTATFHIVYYDSGTGKWALFYDAGSNLQKRAFTMTKKGTNKWKDTMVTVTDAYFGNRQPRGADFALMNMDSDDDIFTLVEVLRGTGNKPAGVSSLYLQEEDIVLAPNPATGKLSVTMPEGIHLLILTDISGREILHTTTTGARADLDVSALPPGLYLVRVQQGAQTIVKKFVKL